MHSVYIITGTVLIIDIGPRIECLKDDNSLKLKGHETNASFNLTCYHPPPPPHQATPRTSPALLAWGWGIVWSGPVWWEGGGANQNTIFSWILQSTCHFLRGWHDGCGPQDHVFRGKNVLKFETNVCMMGTQMDFIFLQKKDWNICPV